MDDDDLLTQLAKKGWKRLEVSFALPDDEALICVVPMSPEQAADPACVEYTLLSLLETATNELRERGYISGGH